jgi:hypothetical protein
MRIGENAFDGCSGLAEILLPEEMEEIGDYAFRDCTKLAEIRLPIGIKYIGYSTFSGCMSLVDIEIPEGVAIISGGAFYRCISLRSIALPVSLLDWGTSGGIQQGAFEGCVALKDVRFAGTQAQWEGMILHEYKNDPILDATVYCIDDAPSGDSGNTTLPSSGTVPQGAIATGPVDNTQEQQEKQEENAENISLVWIVVAITAGIFVVTAVVLVTKKK